MYTLWRKYEVGIVLSAVIYLLYFALYNNSVLQYFMKDSTQLM